MESSIDKYDCIMIDQLRLSATVGPDRWGKVRPQPIALSAKLNVDRSMMIKAGRSDDVSDSVHYGHLAKDLTELVGGREFKSLYDLAWAASAAALAQDSSVSGVTIEASAENQFWRAQAFDVILLSSQGVQPQCRAVIRNLDITTLIGVNPPEREETQRVVVDISFILSADQQGYLRAGQIDWKRVHCNLVTAFEKTTYLTLEAFAHDAARRALHAFNAADRVTICARKPSAIANASSSGVRITRTQEDFQ